MDMDCVYYVVGGDRRSCYMSLTLAEKGYNVFHFDPYDADLLRHCLLYTSPSPRD